MIKRCFFVVVVYEELFCVKEEFGPESNTILPQLDVEKYFTICYVAFIRLAME
jgi:hypothetical protein